MTREQLDRINALARKKKAEGLSKEEQAEQAALYRQYLAEVRGQLAEQLDRVYIETEAGEYTKLEKKQTDPEGSLLS
ncbi:MAG: DUF896 domain-containing protein [Christensenellales bacterium]|jgi:uncharacterized protein YnzC (UPF0291/DUF896 family)